MSWAGALAFGLLALIALSGADGRRPRLFATLKPIATLSLLVVVGLPRGTFGAGVAIALVLSALGDAALNRKGERRWFLAGMGFFMLAHAAYVYAFLAGAEARSTMTSTLATVAAALGAAVVLARLWRGIAPPLRAPCVVYGAVIASTVGAASAVAAGPGPAASGALLFAGAVLFYFGDVVLARSLFGTPLRGAQTTSMALYWAGQLGISLAAAWRASGS